MAVPILIDAMCVVHPAHPATKIGHRDGADRYQCQLCVDYANVKAIQQAFPGSTVRGKIKHAYPTPGG